MADYTTTAQVKAIINSKGLVTDSTDDAVIAQLVTAASVHIDNETHRVFVSASATRYFDTPLNSRLLEVDEFTSLTTVTNGDGTVITSADYITIPGNTTPKYGIKLKGSSTYGWTATSAGDIEQAIAIIGYWGYSTACPADIRTAVEGIAVNLYQSRRGQGSDGIAQITAAGVIITPKDVPAFAEAIIRRYTRHT
jgi:hypothetical protein